MVPRQKNRPSVLRNTYAKKNKAINYILNNTSKSCKKNKVFQQPNDSHCHKALHWFDLSREFNLALVFQRWTRKYDSILFRALFYMVPLLIVYFNFACNMYCGTFWKDVRMFTYLDDWGSSLCNNAFFIFSYLLSAYYSNKLDTCKSIIFDSGFQENIPAQRQELENKKKYNFPAILVIAGTIVGGALCCLITLQTSNNCWFIMLPIGLHLYFFLFFCMSWDIFASLLIMVYEIGFIVFYCANDKEGKVFNYNDEEYDQNESVVELLNIIAADFSFAMLYIGLLVIYTVCYLRFTDSGVMKVIVDRGDIVLASVMTILIITLIYLYVPYRELLNSMRIRRFKLMSEYDKEIKMCKDRNHKLLLIEEKIKMAKRRMTFSYKNIFTVVSSILIPLIGLLINYLK